MSIKSSNHFSFLVWPFIAPKKKKIWAFFSFCFMIELICMMGLEALAQGNSSAILVPMDNLQTDHCRAYGLVYRLLEKSTPDIFWLLNYRGGSFLLPDSDLIIETAHQVGVTTERVSADEVNYIINLITEENMDVVPLEMAPRIGIYLPSPQSPDVVASLLRYVGIPFKTIYDDEILRGGLANFDWIHIHHKDFTGQNHKSINKFANNDNKLAKSLGFSKTWMMKQRVSQALHDFVERGGFLFAMCSAAETIDISLAAQGIDIAPTLIDGDPADPQTNQNLNYANTFAFTDFTVLTDSMSDYSDIDVPTAGPGTTFSLFDFSAKVDPIPCLLNQNHVRTIAGFDGETTSFRRSLIKKTTVILAENNDGVSVRYLMGYIGKGFFCFYGGHTPGRTEEDYKRASPGFRLILNNVLFPSAKVKKRKT